MSTKATSESSGFLWAVVVRSPMLDCPLSRALGLTLHLLLLGPGYQSLLIVSWMACGLSPPEWEAMPLRPRQFPVSSLSCWHYSCLHWKLKILVRVVGLLGEEQTPACFSQCIFLRGTPPFSLQGRLGRDPFPYLHPPLQVHYTCAYLIGEPRRVFLGYVCILGRSLNDSGSLSNHFGWE